MRFLKGGGSERGSLAGRVLREFLEVFFLVQIEQGRYFSFATLNGIEMTSKEQLLKPVQSG